MTILDNYMFRPLLAIFRLSLRELKVLTLRFLPYQENNSCLKRIGRLMFNETIVVIKNTFST